MSESYSWVNVDKKEYMVPSDFDSGTRRTESCSRSNELLRALYSLLSDRWKGCHIFWMGDERSLPEKIDSELFSVIKVHCDEIGYGDDMFDTVCDTYRNVSAMFKTSQVENIKEEIGYYIEELEEGSTDSVNEYGINPLAPYDGLFLRDGCDFRFVINATKRVAYSLESTKIMHKDGDELDFVDPLPLLLGYGRYYDPGEWIGDIIEVADELPDSVTLLECIFLDW